MSTNTCIDPQIGLLLHAYELDSLRGDELERFEAHLIACTRCFEDVGGFQAEAALLRDDPEVRALASDAAAKTAPMSAPTAGRLRDRLWQPIPWPWRPLVPYAALLLALAAGAAAWLVRPQPQVQALQAITLVPGRSGGDAVLHAASGGQAAVRFVFEGASPTHACTVTLRSSAGQTVFEDPAFRAFDEHQSGWLLLPLARLAPGTYRLVIVDPQATASSNTREYVFQIEP